MFENLKFEDPSNWGNPAYVDEIPFCDMLDGSPVACTADADSPLHVYDEIYHLVELVNLHGKKIQEKDGFRCNTDIFMLRGTFVIVHENASEDLIVLVGQDSVKTLLEGVA